MEKEIKYCNCDGEPGCREDLCSFKISNNPKKEVEKMDKRTFKRIKMLHEEGMSLKGAIVVLIDLCKSSDEAGEMIGELIETQPGADYDRGFVDAMKSAGCSTQGITKRKELRNYDPPT